MADDGTIFDDGVLRITRTSSPPGLAIAGDIDESTYAGLVGALERCPDDLAEIHVNLREVEFCDLAGLRAIVRLANGGDHDDGGRRVVLHEVPRQITRVLKIVGWDTTPGLFVDRVRPDQR